MPQLNHSQLIELRDAFNSFSRSDSKENQETFRKHFLIYIRQLDQVTLPVKNEDIEFIQGEQIRHVHQAMETELSPCYTIESRNHHFPTAVLISIPAQYRRFDHLFSGKATSLDTVKNKEDIISCEISSRTKKSIAELMLFLVRTLSENSTFITSPRSASSVPEDIAPPIISDILEESLKSQFGESYGTHTKHYDDLLGEIAHYKENTNLRNGYLSLLQSSHLFPIAAQFAHLIKYQEQLTQQSLNQYQSSVKSEVIYHNYEENIERALCVFSPVRAKVHYKKIPDASEQILFDLRTP